MYNWSFDEKFKSDLAKQKEKKDKENGNGAASNGNAENGAAKTENGSAENGNGKPAENGTDGVSQEEREKKEKTSIPLQLQRLFARLQLCDVQAVKTKARKLFITLSLPSIIVIFM